MKQCLSSPPILVHYNPEAETELRTDASTVGIGYRLVQLQSNKKWHTVSNGSRKLTDTETRYPISELECLAVIFGLNKNRCYLLGIKFRIVTDHKALKALMTKKELPGRLARWAVVIADYPEAEIIHRPGSKMDDVDLLSRHPVEEAISSEEPTLPDENFLLISDTNEIPTHEDYLNAQQIDPRIKQIFRHLIENEMVSNKYVIKNDLLYSYRKDGIVLELPESLINNVLYIHHDHQFSGHHGITRTLQRIKDRFNFPKMKQRVENYVKSCKDCLTRRRPPGKPYGLMQITKAKMPAEKWYMDYLGPFVKSIKGNKYVLVCVDSFTRYIETTATMDTTAETTADILINQIICRHGLFYDPYLRPRQKLYVTNDESFCRTYRYCARHHECV